jgi:DNA-binding GntR family transcriptional regulator
MPGVTAMAEKNFSLQFPVSLVEQITEYLSNEIIEGKVKNGQQLVENELQRRFGISRGPIREAFRILEENGFLISVPRKGTFVRKISRKEIEDNFTVRSHLESFSASLAVPFMTDEDIERMELALSGMRESAGNNDFKSHLKHHGDFHAIFINASKNDVLIKILENLRRQATWFRFSYVYLVQEPFEYALSVHREILDLFIKKDARGVESLVKKHVLVALQDFIRLLASKEK